MVVSALFRFRLCMYLLFSLILSQNSFSQQNKVLISAEKIVYKKIDSTLLNLHIYKPLNFHKDSIYDCIVFFHGGGWNNLAQNPKYKEIKTLLNKEMLLLINSNY